MRPETVEEFQEAWAILERLWAGTEQRARALPPNCSTNGSATSGPSSRRCAVRFRECCLGRAHGARRPRPGHPLDLPWDEAPGWDGIPWDRDARPSLDEVIAEHEGGRRWSRRDRGLRPNQLASPDADRAGWPQLEDFPLKQCLFIVDNEQGQTGSRRA